MLLEGTVPYLRQLFGLIRGLGSGISVLLITGNSIEQVVSPWLCRTHASVRTAGPEQGSPDPEVAPGPNLRQGSRCSRGSHAAPALAPARPPRALRPGFAPSLGAPRPRRATLPWVGCQGPADVPPRRTRPESGRAPNPRAGRARHPPPQLRPRPHARPAGTSQAAPRDEEAGAYPAPGEPCRAPGPPCSPAVA